MAEFKIDVDVGGLERKFKIIVDGARDFSSPLRQFSVYLREKAKKRFQAEGPGWAPLSEATTKKLEHTRTHRITAQGKLRKSAEVAVRKKLARDVRAGKATKLALREFRQILGKSTRTDNLAISVRHLLGSKSNKTIDRLEKDLARAGSKTATQRRGGAKKSDKKHKLLGRLASTLTAEINRNRLDVYSKAGVIGAIHNDGGTAGHGARIPARTFLELEPEDLEYLAFLVQGQLVEAFNEG